MTIGSCLQIWQKKNSKQFIKREPNCFLETIESACVNNLSNQFPYQIYNLLSQPVIYTRQSKMTRRISLKKPKAAPVQPSFYTGYLDQAQLYFSQLASHGWVQWLEPLYQATREDTAEKNASQVPAESRSIEEIQQMLLRSKSRLNWNYFVGDPRFKTDFFMRFRASTTARLYEHWVLSGSLYSTRLWLLTLFICMYWTNGHFAEISPKQQHITVEPSTLENAHDLVISELEHPLTEEQTSEFFGDYNDLQQAEQSSSYTVMLLSWLLRNCIQLIGLAAGLTASIERGWPLLRKQVLLNGLGFLAMLRLMRVYRQTCFGAGVAPVGQAVDMIIRMSLLVPTFVTSLLILENWMKFAAFTTAQLVGASFLFSIELWLMPDSNNNNNDDPAVAAVPPASPITLERRDFQISTFVYDMAYMVSTAIFIFAMLEKVNKERFVINQSNQQSRKMLGELVNCCCATVTVSPEGKISLFNDAFNSLVKDRLLFEALPANIFSIFQDDTDEKGQLKFMLQDVSAFERGQRDHFDRSMLRNVIEVRIPRSKQPQGNQINSGGKKRKVRAFPQLFEMVRISCQKSQYSPSKQLILSFECINDYQGHAQLIVQHSYSLQAFLASFQEQVEQQIVPSRRINIAENRHENKHFKETFRYMMEDMVKPQQMLCCLEQVQFQVKLMSIMSVAQTLWNGHRTENDFMLLPNLLHSLEMTSNMLTHHSEINLDHDDCLPEVINGDMEMLLLAVRTISEFSLKYCNSTDKIMTRTILDGLSDDETYLISFNFNLAVNPGFDNEDICQMLDVNDPFGLGSTTDDINTFLLQRSITYQDHLEQFGIGLLILPCLVSLLEGKIWARLDTRMRKRKYHRQKSSSNVTTRSAKSANDGEAKKSIIINLQVPLRTADKDSAEGHIKPVTATASMPNRREENGMTSWVSPSMYRYHKGLIRHRVFERDAESLRDAGMMDMMDMMSELSPREMPQVSKTPILRGRSMKPDAFSEGNCTAIIKPCLQMGFSDSEASPTVIPNSSGAIISQNAERQFSIRSSVPNQREDKVDDFLDSADPPKDQSKFQNGEILVQSHEDASRRSSQTPPSQLARVNSNAGMQAGTISMANIPAPGQITDMAIFSRDCIKKKDSSRKNLTQMSNDSIFNEELQMESPIPAKCDEKGLQVVSKSSDQTPGSENIARAGAAIKRHISSEKMIFHAKQKQGTAKRQQPNEASQVQIQIELMENCSGSNSSSSLSGIDSFGSFPNGKSFQLASIGQQSVSMASSGNLKALLNQQQNGASPEASLNNKSLQPEEEKQEALQAAPIVEAQQQPQSQDDDKKQLIEQKNQESDQVQPGDQNQQNNANSPPRRAVFSSAYQSPHQNSLNCLRPELPLEPISERLEHSGTDEEEGKISLLGENMPSLFFDEKVPGRDLHHILADPNLKDKLKKPPAKPQIEEEIKQPQASVEGWNEADFDEDDDEQPVLTDQQKKDLRIRKRKLMEEYYQKLTIMRNAELQRREQVLKKKNSEIESAVTSKYAEDIPLILMRFDDHISEQNKLQDKGATGNLMASQNASREHLRQNNPPLLSARGQKRDRKLEEQMFEKDQKVRKVHRKIYEQSAIIQTQKEQHEAIRASLVEVPEPEILPQPGLPNHRDSAGVRSNYSGSSFSGQDVSRNSQQLHSEPAQLVQQMEAPALFASSAEAPERVKKQFELIERAPQKQGDIDEVEKPQVAPVDAAPDKSEDDSPVRLPRPEIQIEEDKQEQAQDDSGGKPLTSFAKLSKESQLELENDPNLQEPIESDPSVSDAADKVSLNQAGSFIEKADIQNLRKLANIDLSKLQLDAEVSFTIRNVQSVIAKIDQGRRHSCNSVLQEKVIPLLQQDDSNQSEQKYQDAKERKNAANAPNGSIEVLVQALQELNSGASEGAQHEQDEAQGSPEDSKKVKNEVKLVKRALSMAEQQIKAQKVASPARLISKPEPDNALNIDQFILLKQKSIVQSLVPGIGVIEEEKSIWQRSVSDDSSAEESRKKQRISKQASSKLSKHKSASALVKQPYSKKRKSSKELSMESPQMDMQSNEMDELSVSEPNSSDEKHISSSYDERLERPSSKSLRVMEDFGFSQGEQTPKSKKMGDHMNQSLDMAKHNRRKMSREDLQKSSSEAMLKSGASLSKIRQNRRGTIREIELPKRTFRNRGLLKLQCQKVPGVDNYFLLQKLRKRDDDINIKGTQWCRESLEAKKAAKQSQRLLRKNFGAKEEDSEDDGAAEENEEGNNRSSTSSSIDEIYKH